MADVAADPYRAARLILALRQNGVTNSAVLKVMERVDRSQFAPGAPASLAFEDAHLPLPAGQTIASPIVTAQILAAATYTDPPSGRALLIGAGSGYSTILLSGLVGQVISVERSVRLAEIAREQVARRGLANATVLHGDGLTGWREHGPFNFIFAIGTLLAVPDAVLTSLSEDGTLIAPVGDFENAELQVWRDRRCVSKSALLSPLMPLRAGVAKVL